MRRLDHRAGKPLTILIADDDERDRILAREALAEVRLLNEIRFVSDGEQLLDYLYRRGAFAPGRRPAPRPGIILLDLNMPRKDGREALEEIKADPALAGIPIVVLTTSQAELDVVRSYQLGVSSYIHKPVTFTGLAEALRSFARYWFEIVELPAESPGAGAGVDRAAG